MSFEYRHESSVPLAFRLSSPAQVTILGRKRHGADERPKTMLRRRRQTRKLLRVARMFRDLDAVAHDRAERRRGDRVAVGRAA
jgi:hypothetical protein